MTGDQHGFQADLFAHLRERAQREPEFRQHLVDEPKQAIGEAVGVEIPDAVTVRTIEEGPGEIVLVLPSPGETPGEVAEADLLSVAGGWNWSLDTHCPNYCTPNCG